MSMNVRYATRHDGARIAYRVSGDGPPLIVPPGWVSHLEVFEGTDAGRAFASRLAEHFMVVMYDRHGCGLSDRDRTDFSVDDDVLDLAAAVDAVGADRVRIFAYCAGGPPTIKFTAEKPARVERIAFFGAGAGGGAKTKEEIGATDALAALVRAHWGMGSRALTDVLIGAFSGSSSSPELVDEYDHFQRIGATGETAARLLEGGADVDVRESLPSLTMPTIVLHRRGDQFIPFADAQRLAMLLPNSRFVPLEGNNHVPWAGDIDSLLEPALAFLRSDDSATGQASTSEGGRGVRTVLVTDLVDHTAMMQRLGDERGRDVLREHERITREMLRAHGGVEVKTLGDGFMASFASVTKAVDCSIALQRVFETREGEPLRVRVGLNAGEPIEEDGDLYGATVILASRIAARADAGEILVPDTVRGLLSGKGFVFGDRGEFVPKGFDEGVRLWDVRWRE